MDHKKMGVLVILISFIVTVTLSCTPLTATGAISTGNENGPRNTLPIDINDLYVLALFELPSITPSTTPVPTNIPAPTALPIEIPDDFTLPEDIPSLDNSSIGMIISEDCRGPVNITVNGISLSTNGSILKAPPGVNIQDLLKENISMPINSAKGSTAGNIYIEAVPLDNSTASIVSIRLEANSTEMLEGLEYTAKINAFLDGIPDNGTFDIDFNELSGLEDLYLNNRANLLYLLQLMGLDPDNLTMSSIDTVHFDPDLTPETYNNDLPTDDIFLMMDIYGDYLLSLYGDTILEVIADGYPGMSMANITLELPKDGNFNPHNTYVGLRVHGDSYEILSASVEGDMGDKLRFNINSPNGFSEFAIISMKENMAHKTSNDNTKNPQSTSGFDVFVFLAAIITVAAISLRKK